ncbi:MAG: 30S ribosomal protein S8 [Patescibacteria group bacterium]
MDTIANMLTSIRNAQAVKKETVKVPYSKFKSELAEVLNGLGFISAVGRGGKKEKKYLEITLKYNDGQGAISQLKRISKPGQRLYSGFADFRWPRGAILIVSTPKGLMTGEQAKKNKLGGELICLIS